MMRCLFSMFAEDVGLLPENIMVEMLEKLADEPAAFPRAMETLWTNMNAGDFDQRTFKAIKKFKGGLFAHPKASPWPPKTSTNCSLPPGRIGATWNPPFSAPCSNGRLIRASAPS
ncbi:MAG: hypothetical protein MO852_08010 [Candidatus Devosia euplotis]|nr:hypothetical protein [Candidatus Devosia euplotis]